MEDRSGQPGAKSRQPGTGDQSLHAEIDRVLGKHDEVTRLLLGIRRRVTRRRLPSREVALSGDGGGSGPEQIVVKREIMAMSLLLVEPEIGLEELARRVGVTRRTLYNWDQVGQVLRGRRQDRRGH